MYSSVLRQSFHFLLFDTHPPTLFEAGAMNFLRLLPVILSFLLLAAHFYRSGQLVVTALCLAMLLLLFLKKSWIPRLFQVVLLLGALEWLRSLYFLAAMRIAWDQPWTRLAVILGAVAIFTAISGLVFQSRALKAMYRPDKA